MFQQTFATFISSIILITAVIPVNPHRIGRSQYESNKNSRSRDASETDTNWTPPNNHQQHRKVQVTTLDINRGFTPYPSAIPVSFVSPKKPVRNCVQNFCENVENYPEDLVKRVALNGSKSLESYFKQAEVPFDLNNRGAFDEEEDTSDTMCPVKSVTLYPRTAKNTKDEERILVNVEGARQGIVFEICLLENSKCKYSAGFPIGYVATCKQKYTRKSLAILDGENQNTAWDTFQIPSCCVCVVKKE